MNALGRGLASLIPRRQRQEAEELIDDIDEAVEPVEPVTPAEETPVVDEPVSTTVEIKQVTIQHEEETITQQGADDISEFEELANDDEKVPMPPKPNVTPLTFDKVGNLVEATAEPVMTETVAAPKKATPPKKRSKAAVKQQEEEVGPVSTDDFMERRVLGEKVQYVAMGDIEVNPEQPRRNFEEAELGELMQSLEQHGMLQPMVVMDKADGSGYQIIAGERRWRAAKQLGWTEVPVVVRSGVTGDKNRLELALTENVQRENLNPIEEALGYKRLNEEYGMSHEEIGQRVGKSRVAITNIIRILQLPTEIQRGLVEGKITVGHARAILMIPDADKQVRFYQHVVEEGLTVRKTEVRARNIQRNMNVQDTKVQRGPARAQLPMAYQFDAALQNFYGYNAKVRFNAPKNRFEVRFYAHSENEIEELVNMLLRRKELPKNVDADVLED